MTVTRRYNLVWEDMDDLQIEMSCVRKGGKWKMADGKEYGNGLFEHFRRMQNLLWPDEDDHRWSNLMLSTILTNRITVVAGAKDSGKTHTMSKFALTDYFCFPQETLTMMSSTDIRGFELRVWGDVKDLFDRARERFPYLPGNVVDAKHGIFTDALDDTGDVRDMRKGILCIPCIGSSGEFVGISKFVGVKQKRRRLLGDEVQFMQQSYLDSMANLDKGQFLGCFVGNPIGNGDPLDKLSEPMIGWDALGEVTKTMTWKNKFGGTTINFVGVDSPNFDQDKPKSYPYLIDKTDVERIGERYGKDSALFWSQIMGVRKAGINAHRVLTMDMCRKYGAFDSCVWSGSDTVKVFGIDAGYGGDLCVGICGEFGADITGGTVIKFHEPVVIPVRLSAPEIVEDQIATFAKGECLRMGIPDEHVYIEAGMRATLAVSFSRIMSPRINAVNFGGAATERPVSNDLFIFDERTGQRRHKKANEHYSKYVTQLWFSVRAAVESKQVRDLPKKVAEEFCMREWYMVHGDRYELETKIECKERIGVSPNYADACAVCLEGALRLGFQIERLKVETPDQMSDNSWLDKALKEERDKRSKYQLTYNH